MRRLLIPPTALLALLCLAAPAGAITIPIGPPAIDTTITGGPLDGSTIEDETPSFSFVATSDGKALDSALFQCSVEGAPDQPCTSPFALPALEEEGRHILSVYAEDPETGDRDPSPATRVFFFADESEGEEECEAGELEDEEGDVEECAIGESSSVPPPECLLRTARARLLTNTDRETVRLVVHYTSYAPADGEVDFSLGAGRGSLRLGEAREHLSKHGVLRVTEKLSKFEAAKVRAARRFSVDLEISAAPSFCGRYETRQLTIRRSVHGLAVWLQSGSAFGVDS